MSDASELNRVSAALQALATRVDQISIEISTIHNKLAKLEQISTETASATRSVTGTAEASPALNLASEDVLEWVGKSSLLERASTVSFLLVIALIFRTVTDNGLVGSQFGALLGLGYAGFLILFGGYLYFRRKLTRAPVFAISGAILMFMVVIETHARFQSVPALPAHGMLILTGLAMTLISHFHGASLPIAVGAFGMGISSLLLDVKEPHFPYLALSLLAGNAFAWCSIRVHRTSWLRWLLLFFLLLAFFIWGVTLGSTLFKTEQAPLPHFLGLNWFLPGIAGVVALVSVASLLGILRSIRDHETRLRKFDFLAPMISVTITFLLADYFVGALRGNRALLGWIAVLVAITHAGIAHWITRNAKPGAPGPLAFLLSGSALMALALPVATGNPLLGFAILPLWAIGIVLPLMKWSESGARVISCLLQTYVALLIGWTLLGRVRIEASWEAALAAGMLGLIGLIQYAKFHSGIQRKHHERSIADRTAVLILVSGLAGCFFLFREAALAGLTTFSGSQNLLNAFSSAQSVIINSGAVLLMVIAVARRDREIRNVSVLITVIGITKLLIIDLLTLKGVPLVASVLSFAIATSIESIALARWKQGRTPAALPER